MRRLLGVLREDAEDAGATVADRHPQPGLPQLAELIDAAREASGAGTRLIVSGPVDRVRPGRRARRLPHRAGGADQRAAARAGRGRRRRAALRRDDALRLRVRDNGPGPTASAGQRRAVPAGRRPGHRRTTAPTGARARPARHARASRSPSAGRCGRGRAGRRIPRRGRAAGETGGRRAADAIVPSGGGPRERDDRHRRRRRPRGGAGRVRRAARHAAGLHRARHGRGRRRGGAGLPGAAARRGPDGRPDAGHRRDRGDQAADGRRRARARAC